MSPVRGVGNVGLLTGGSVEFRAPEFRKLFAILLKELFEKMSKRKLLVPGTFHQVKKDFLSLLGDCEYIDPRWFEDKGQKNCEILWTELCLEKYRLRISSNHEVDKVRLQNLLIELMEKPTTRDKVDRHAEVLLKKYEQDGGNCIIPTSVAELVKESARDVITKLSIQDLMNYAKRYEEHVQSKRFLFEYIYINSIYGCKAVRYRTLSKI
mgnify:CR=1 FL=1